ncbi:SDR family NAD(P)-dependent oxidoreductase [Chroococcidiopsis sp.]|uniref:SDR family NAD(P)-dependent oxidoreductase n=1 Tax=Chroococcidiopsis sp. TaxID=3088168 RepID=UPI003F39D446
MTAFIILGASRGLGEILHRFVPESGDTVWLISRSPPTLNLDDGIIRHWLEVDLSQPDAIDRVVNALEQSLVDVVIYNAGIWEKDAFTPNYCFEAVSDKENQRILTINLISAISCVRKLLPNLRMSGNPKIILIGSANNHDFVSGKEVAYATSKFGLRGFANALRENTRQDKIGVTLLNPGTFGTIRFEGKEAIVEPVDGYEGCISPTDLVDTVKLIVRLSRTTCMRDIDIVAMEDPL